MRWTAPSADSKPALILPPEVSVYWKHKAGKSLSQAPFWRHSLVPLQQPKRQFRVPAEVDRKWGRELTWTRWCTFGWSRLSA
eukprot:scaffold7288_cov100-Amphora_coffeaeformis.AAC.1